MQLNEVTKQFIKEHAGDDPVRLLLSAARYPEVDMPFAVEQIQARKQIKDKLPGWYQHTDLIFPSKISAEQCSSESTAFYKQQLVEEGQSLCDLTGGLGIDSYYFSRKVRQVTYIERFPEYCEAARQNFSVLQADNVIVKNGDATELLQDIDQVDVFYIDPARRGGGNKRVFALQDCEPDLPRLLPQLLQKAPRVIAKLSPMVDIKMTLDLLPGTTAIHVLSVKNDCKELLFVIEGEPDRIDPVIYCWNLSSDREELFTTSPEEEKRLSVGSAADIKRYLYEPNTSVLKAGAFKAVTRTGVEKLHPHSHLYTSEELVNDFPGRKFRIEEVIPFTGKTAKNLSKDIPQANITVRNFPLTVEELRKRTRIKEGGDIYLFATTCLANEKALVKCRKV
ncbi:MAG: class I SAM-dependent methyltransferase [Tannerellaceae bacterium]|nr:class I SAM-dependent methyltransferase [Tannerellaceae bacterium]